MRPKKARVDLAFSVIHWGNVAATAIVASGSRWAIGAIAFSSQPKSKGVGTRYRRPGTGFSLTRSAVKGEERMGDFRLVTNQEISGRHQPHFT